MDVDKALKAANKDLAGKVVDQARSRVYPAVSGRSSKGRVINGRKSKKGTGLTATRDSIRASATATASAVLLGGSKAPAALGHEFGGGRRPTTRQFPPWTGNTTDSGYFLYPTIREELQGYVDQYWPLIREAVKPAFPEG